MERVPRCPLATWQHQSLEAFKHLYDEAIALATKHGERELKATAQLYMAREEALAHRNGFSAIFSAALKEVAKLHSPTLKAIAAGIEREILKQQIPVL